MNDVRDSTAQLPCGQSSHIGQRLEFAPNFQIATIEIGKQILPPDIEENKKEIFDREERLLVFGGREVLLK